MKSFSSQLETGNKKMIVKSNIKKIMNTTDLEIKRLLKSSLATKMYPESIVSSEVTQTTTYLMILKWLHFIEILSFELRITT